MCPGLVVFVVVVVVVVVVDVTTSYTMCQKPRHLVLGEGGGDTPEHLRCTSTKDMPAHSTSGMCLAPLALGSLVVDVL